MKKLMILLICVTTLQTSTFGISNNRETDYIGICFENNIRDSDYIGICFENNTRDNDYIGIC